MPSIGLVDDAHRPRPIPEHVDLIRSLTVFASRLRGRVPSQICRSPRSTGPATPSDQRSSIMPTLADTVDVVIGVDPHKHTHTAAIVGADTGKHHASRTTTADPRGF